jgi:translation initiation factor 1 (eIF-1/SUI1)
MTPKDKPGSTPLAHNPFGKLAALRPQAPEQPAAETKAVAHVAPTPTEFAPKVVVRREKKGHGGKTATIVEGVLPAVRESMATEMKKAFGCGARVEEDAIVLQGDIPDRACAWLEKRGAKKVVRGS